MPEDGWMDAYQISLYSEGQRIARFQLPDLPVPGLQFEVGDKRWRVELVTVAVIKDDQMAHVVECDVRVAARWNKETERWERVAPHLVE